MNDPTEMSEEEALAEIRSIVDAYSGDRFGFLDQLVSMATEWEEELNSLADEEADDFDDDEDFEEDFEIDGEDFEE
jgi:hypothetical protein